MSGERLGLRALVEAVLEMRRDLRRLALSSSPVLSRGEVAELLGAREGDVGAWLDQRPHLLAETPGKERRYCGARVRAELEAVRPAAPRAGRAPKNVIQLPRP